MKNLKDYILTEAQKMPVMKYNKGGKFVEVTKITDKEYFALDKKYYEYDKQIRDLRSQLNDVESQISNLQSDMEETVAQAPENEKDKAANDWYTEWQEPLDKKKDELEAKIAKLSSKQDEVEKQQNGRRVHFTDKMIPAWQLSHVEDYVAQEDDVEI